jgi:hypothetical protein
VVAGCRGRRRVRVGVVAHGWNVDEPAPVVGPHQYAPSRPRCGSVGVGTCRVWWWGGRANTLLGPEATGRPPAHLRSCVERELPAGGPGVGGAGFSLDAGHPVVAEPPNHLFTSSLGGVVSLRGMVFVGGSVWMVVG